MSLPTVYAVAAYGASVLQNRNIPCNYQRRMGVFMLNFLATLILAAVPTIEVSATPVQPGLPAYVQTMSAEDYEAWAIWQNKCARDKAEKDVLFSDDQPFYTVNRTTVKARSGGFARNTTNGGTSRSTSRGRNTSRSRSTRNVSTQRNQSGWRAITSATIPTRYRNPNYVPTSIMIYSPYVKSTSEREPDWNNLFVPLDDGPITVAEAMKLINRPMPPETLFRLLMMPPEVISIEVP